VEKIYQHIEKLLAQHDYVVVPELGGFVTQWQSAILLNDRIIPPMHTIGFNALMQHSDGLLAIEVARGEGISYRKALELIENEVTELNKVLSEQNTANFGRLGVFAKYETGNLQFTPSSNSVFLPSNFGLNEIFISELKEIKNSTTNKVSFVLPTRRSFKYAAAAVLLFGMLMISPQVNDMRQTSTASLISLPSLQTEAIVDTVQIIQEPEAICPELTETVLENGIVENNDSALYHVVVASLPNKESAENYCEKLKHENFECAHVLAPIKSFRVALKSFENRDEAIAYMENLRKTDERFETAWVLCK
jgi:hypothetical protein